MLKDLVRIEQRPGFVSFNPAHEDIRNRDRGKNVKRLCTDIAGLNLKVQKVQDIPMPDIQRRRNSPQACTKLIDGGGCIIDQPHPRDNAARGALHLADRRTFRANMPKIYPHPTAELRDLRHVLKGMIDRTQIIVHVQLETTGKLMKIRPGIHQRWRRKGQLLGRDDLVYLLGDHQTLFLRLGKGQKKCHGHIHFLRQLINLLIWIQ